MKQTDGALGAAIKREDWNTVALCLVLGVIKTASRYSPETLDAMIAELAGELDGPRERAHRDRRGKGRGARRGRG